MQLVLRQDIVSVLEADELDDLSQEVVADIHDDVEEVSVAQNGPDLIQNGVDGHQFCGKNTACLWIADIFQEWLEPLCGFEVYLLVEIVFDSINRLLRHRILHYRNKGLTEANHLLKSHLVSDVKEPLLLDEAALALKPLGGVELSH